MGYDGNLWVDLDIDQPVLDQPVYLPLVQSGPIRSSVDYSQ
jgi:hypothetical protein